MVKIRIKLPITRRSQFKLMLLNLYFYEDKHKKKDYVFEQFYIFSITLNEENANYISQSQ